MSDGLYQSDLIENDLARLRESENRQCIGDLLQRNFKAGKVGNDLTITTNEQVKTVFYPDQFFAQRCNHRAHGAPIRACQLGALLIDHGAVR